jgi:hypothetical protein
MKAVEVLLKASLTICVWVPLCSAADPNLGEVPLLTGDFGFLSGMQSGHQEFGPKFEPIILLPLSIRLLVEAEYTAELPIERTNGKLGPAVFGHSVEYMQIDYSATNSLTIVAGYFATPFGIYKERIDPLWIRNFIDTPLLYPANDNSSAGVMIRGGVFASQSLKINYAVSVGGSVENSQFDSAKRTSSRLSIYVPSARLEVGSSFGRTFATSPYNMYGFDTTYRPQKVPIDIRGEGVWSRTLGNGYWLEGAYKFQTARRSFLRQSQALVRAESFSPGAAAADLVDGLPEIDSKRLSVGWNYWLKDAVRLSAAYERLWARDENANGVNLALVYRFTMPIGRAQ